MKFKLLNLSNSYFWFMLTKFQLKCAIMGKNSDLAIKKCYISKNVNA